MIRGLSITTYFIILFLLCTWRNCCSNCEWSSLMRLIWKLNFFRCLSAAVRS